MSSKRNGILFLAAAGMELSWLLAISVLLLSFTGVSPVLFVPMALAAFFLGGGITIFTQNSNWRLIYRLGLHLFVFAVLLLHSFYSASYGGESFWSARWLESLVQGPQDLNQGILWAALLFITILLWGGGIFLARRSQAYYAITARFDVGITAFVLTFIVVGVTDALALPVMLLLLPFFLTSMVAIALARNQKGDGQGAFQQKYRGNGPILAFALTVLLGGGALVLFFLPFLTIAAEAGHSAMQQYGTPLVKMMGNMILFIFRLAPRASRPAQEQGGSPGIQALPEINGEQSVWDRVFILVFTMVISAVLLLAAGWGIRQIFRWLFSGANRRAKGRGMRELLWGYLQKWRFFGQLLLGWIVLYISRLLGRRKKGEAAHIFRRLLKWGRWSGFDRLAAETPYEYAMVLGRHFPGARAEIELIVCYFNDEVYGKEVLNGGQKRLLWRAWRSLCSPRRWPARFFKRLAHGANLKVREIDPSYLKPGIEEKGNKKTNNGGNV